MKAFTIKHTQIPEETQTIMFYEVKDEKGKESIVCVLDRSITNFGTQFVILKNGHKPQLMTRLNDVTNENGLKSKYIILS